MENKTRASQEKIFRELYDKNKGTPMAVSSESYAHKWLRFENVASIFKDMDDISVHDVGMGVADFYSFLTDNFPGKKIEYSGSEILQEFVDESRRRFPHLTFHNRDIAERSGVDRYDFVIMSGVFHQRRDTSIPEWERFAQQIILNSFNMARKGLSFNMVSPFVDFYQTQVYYGNLFKFITFINDNLSRFFTIHHDYALFEFTIHVFREEFVKELYPQTEFAKYFKV